MTYGFRFQKLNKGDAHIFGHFHIFHKILTARKFPGDTNRKNNHKTLLQCILHRGLCPEESIFKPPELVVKCRLKMVQAHKNACKTGCFQKLRVFLRKLKS